MKKILYIFLIIGFSSYGQNNAKNFRTKLFQVVSDTIQIDSVSISPFNFKVQDLNKQEIDTSEYRVNFETAQLIIDKNKFTTVTVEYNALPEFLTKAYSRFNKNFIVSQATDLSRLYSVQEKTQNNILSEGKKTLKIGIRLGLFREMI